MYPVPAVRGRLGGEKTARVTVDVCETSFAGGRSSTGRVRTGFRCAWLRPGRSGSAMSASIHASNRPAAAVAPRSARGIFDPLRCPAPCAVRRLVRRWRLPVFSALRPGRGCRRDARRCSIGSSGRREALDKCPGALPHFQEPHVGQDSHTLRAPSSGRRRTCASAPVRSAAVRPPAEFSRCDTALQPFGQRYRPASVCRRGVCGPDFIVSSDVLRKGKRFFRIGEISGAEFRRRVRSQWKNGSREWGGERQEASMSFPAGIHRSAAPLIY